MKLLAFSGLINGIVAIGFGIFIVLKNRHGKLNQLFFLMTLAIAVWAFSYWQWLSASTQGSALFWVRILSIGSLFIPVFYFHWVLVLLGLDVQKKRLITLLYLVISILLFFTFSPLFIKGVKSKLFFPFWPDPGILYDFYLIFVYIGTVVYSAFLLLKSYKISAYERRGQIFYVLLGVILGFGGASTNFFLWYDIPIPPYGNFLVVVFPFLFGYAIIKHRLFNIAVVTTELLTFAIWIFLLVRILLGDEWRERIIDGSLFVFVVFFGILLIRSVLKEIEQREELERLTEKLSGANEELKKLDSAKSEFISIASHQLRTPLSIIKGYISMIQEGSFGHMTKKLAEPLRRVYLSNERLIKLVNDLLDLSRMEGGRMRYEMKPAQFSIIIASIVEEFQQIAQNKGVMLRFKKEKEDPLVRLDEEKMRQVAFNLIDNAVRYTPKGGSITVTLTINPYHLLFSVVDTGIGLEKQEINSLFQKFVRSREVARIYTEGIGLGLYVARRIVEDHGGRIWAESPGKGKGSTFFVELPIKKIAV